MQVQSTVGIANHGVTAMIITATVIEMSPITMMSNTHIDSIKSTILVSLANLINNKIFFFYKLHQTQFIKKSYKMEYNNEKSIIMIKNN